MHRSTDRFEDEKRELRAARAKGGLAVWRSYLKFSGPGWLQGAITLGGGSLAGSLYLGVLGGFSFLWLQVLAMGLGILMLSAITYVTLSTGERPFAAINRHINPVLGWGWAIATLMANIVWCLPQFALGTAAIQQNLLPGLAGTGGQIAACAALLGAASITIWFYDAGSRGVKLFELILKIMVAVVVVSFFGVVLRMSLGPEGLPWTEIAAGFIPDFSLLTRPAPGFHDTLAGTGPFESFWSRTIVAQQRDVMVTAAATAVGINMTFLLPYSMLKKGWDKESRGLAIFDLSTGLLIPFVLATGCVVIASASQFHAVPQPGAMTGEASAEILRQYEGNLDARLRAEIGGEAWAGMTDGARAASRAALPESDRLLAAMLVKRDAFQLAQSLEKLTGKTMAHYVFGIGVLGMALSTIIILMLISGFTICEMLGLPASGWPHRLGCFVAGLGVLGPFIYTGKTQFWLAVPTSVFGMTLLPIAYFTFFLMINNRRLMGSEMLRGGRRAAMNGAMALALLAAGFGASWSIWDKAGVYGAALVAGFVALALGVQFARGKRTGV